jgi:hypothetical protein
VNSLAGTISGHRSHYSAREDRIIRAQWPYVAAIAELLGRTENAVRGRARKLGLPCASGKPKRLFTDAEREIIRARYTAEGAIPLARELGRTRADIVSIAGRLGVRFDGLWPWTAQDDATLRDMVQRKIPNPQMAAKLNRTPAAVNKRKEFLGLTVQLYDPAVRRNTLLKAHECGRSLSVEIRWARRRIALGEHGWHPDLNPKEIAILTSLLNHGPQSRENLSLSIGEPPTRPLRKRLMTHGGRSAMARLMARGLVARLRMSRSREYLYIYTLTAMALKLRGTFQSVNEFNHGLLRRKSA